MKGQHDDCLLRPAAHEGGGSDGSSHSTLTAYVQMWFREALRLQPREGAYPLPLGYGWFHLKQAFWALCLVWYKESGTVMQDSAESIRSSRVHRKRISQCGQVQWLPYLFIAKRRLIVSSLVVFLLKQPRHCSFQSGPLPLHLHFSFKHILLMQSHSTLTLTFI